MSLSKQKGGPVATLAQPFPISSPAISRHLRVLEKAHLIERKRQGRQQLITCREEGLQPARDWIARCAVAWTFSFDSLDELLKMEAEEGESNGI